VINKQYPYTFLTPASRVSQTRATLTLKKSVRLQICPHLAHIHRSHLACKYVKQFATLPAICLAAFHFAGFCRFDGAR